MDSQPTADDLTAGAKKFSLGLNVVTILATLLIALTVILVLKGPSIYQAFQTRRLDKIAAEAMALVNAERYEAASQALQEGFRVSQDHAGLNRTVAELFLRAHNDPQSAIAFLKRVLNGNGATVADRRRMGEALLQSGDVSEASKLFDALPATEQTNRRGLEFLAGIKRATGDISEADALLRRALMLEPENVEAQLQLAIMDEAQAMEQARAGATQVIWKIAQRHDDAALKAIFHLAHSSSLTTAQSKDLRQLADKHPKTSDRDRYDVLRAYLRLNPLEREAVINAEVARNKGRPMDAMFDFLRWLGLEGQYEQLLKIIPADAVVRDPDVFLLYVDALSAAQRWKELLALMKAKRPPVTPTTVQVILASCYAQLEPNLQRARAELQKAFELNSRSEVAVLLRAAALAETLHLADLAVQGYTLVAEARPVMRIQMLEKVLDLQQGDRTADGMVATLKRLHELRPQNQRYVDRLNYLRLVDGVELEPAYDQIIGYEQPTSSTENAMVVPRELLRALAAWRFGDENRMKLEIAALPDPSKLSAGPRAVIAGLYHLCGRDVEGFHMAEKVPLPLLLDSEKRFLRLTMN